MDEARVAVGHGVVFEAALAALAVVAAVLHGHRDERPECAGPDLARWSGCRARSSPGRCSPGPSWMTRTGAAVPSLYCAGTYTEIERVVLTGLLRSRVVSLPLKMALLASVIENWKLLPLGAPRSREIRLRRVARPDHEVAVAFVAGIGIGAPALAAAAGRVARTPPRPPAIPPPVAPAAPAAGRSTAGAGDRSARPGDTAPATARAAVAPSARHAPPVPARRRRPTRRRRPRLPTPRRCRPLPRRPRLRPADPAALPPPPPAPAPAPAAPATLPPAPALPLVPPRGPSLPGPAVSAGKHALANKHAPTADSANTNGSAAAGRKRPSILVTI